MFRRLLRVVSINILVLLGLFLSAEAGFRVFGYFFIHQDKAFTLANFPKQMNASVLRGNIFPANPHPVLGFAPKPGRYRGFNGARVTIGEDTTRSNGETSPMAGTAGTTVLAVGDSFTYGVQVPDHETWPAYLENLLGVRVINGGVFGYGVGQIYLRAKHMSKALSPDILIIGLIPEDIGRVGLSARMGTPKPVFYRDGKTLRMAPPDQAKVELDSRSYRFVRRVLGAVQGILGYSFLIHEAMMRLYPEAWLSRRFSLRAHDQDAAVSCALMTLFARLPVRRKLVLIQYPAPYVIGNTVPGSMTRVISCARAAGLAIIDTFPMLRNAFSRDKASFSALFAGHMSARGNAFTAQILANRLKKSLQPN